ncbi:MAG: hypothetical protein WDO71_00925 [Bacteroidota bacterium]
MKHINPQEHILFIMPYYALSAINRYKGNFNKSLWYAMECVKDAEKTGDTVIVDYFLW